MKPQTKTRMRVIDIPDRLVEYLATIASVLVRTRAEKSTESSFRMGAT